MGGIGEWTDLSQALGPAEGRYFGAGYRRVEHQFPEPSSGWEGPRQGAVYYPADWSLDADGTQRTPHLSSVDAIVLPLLLCRHNDPLLADALKPASWRIQGIELKAGSSPWTDLGRVPVEVLSPPAWNAGFPVGIGAKVGNIRVRIDLSKEDQGGHGTKNDDRACSPNSIRDLRTGPAAGDCRVRQSAMMRPELHSVHEDWSSELDDNGKGSGEESLPTAIDYFVLMGQLTQALIYAAYATDRAHISNVWMRSIRMSLQETSLTSNPFQATTTLLRDAEIKVGKERIRSLTIQSRTSHGVSAEALVALTCRPTAAA